MAIFEEFKNITGLELLSRQTNYLSGYTERKDSLFSRLAVLYFSEQKKFKKLQQKIKVWLKKEKTETIFALTGYTYYISEDYKKAKSCFLKAISLNPDNLDNWIDLAFALRHNGEYEISNGILFNYNYIIHYYKYLKLTDRNYLTLKKLVLEVVKRTHNA